MLNKIWPMFIIISFVYAIFTGNLDNANQSVFKSCEDAVNLSITFLGTICLWNGIMKIASKTTFVCKLSKILKPFMKFLFPEIKENDEVYNDISMNIIANVFGLGNAATPLGLKAMEKMQKDNNNKDTLTNSMAMFILINTASLQLIPTTVIAIRNSLGSRKCYWFYCTCVDFINLCTNCRNYICKSFYEEMVSIG